MEMLLKEASLNPNVAVSLVLEAPFLDVMQTS